MARPIRLFVSSSPELVAEREAIGQAVAALPVSVGWEIKHTPRAGEDTLAAAEFAASCDIMLVVLGTDFAAPMGLELRRALDARKLILAYVKKATYSPSAQTALRDTAVSWMPFDTPRELKETLTRALASSLLDLGEQFGLHVSEIEPLLKLAGRESDKSANESSAADDSRRGAERGGVILGRGTV